jgi:hypothetical protein
MSKTYDAACSDLCALLNSWIDDEIDAEDASRAVATMAIALCIMQEDPRAAYAEFTTRMGIAFDGAVVDRPSGGSSPRPTVVLLNLAGKKPAGESN